jgi:hypothetical protein
MNRSLRSFAMVALAGAALLVSLPGPAHAVSNCKAVTRAKDGVIQVSAKNVALPLYWGYTASDVTQSFADPSCISGGSAQKCQLGSGAVAVTPPELCTLYLADSAGNCSVRLKGCTAGLRRQDPPFIERFTTSSAGAACSGEGLGQCTLSEVRQWAGNCLPKGYAYAHGQLMPVLNNFALFSLLDIKYGGNGASTFGLPDMSGLEPAGVSYIICVEGLYP